MRKLIVLEHISLDGVIQAPGGAQEDTSGGFMLGGWIAPYADAVLTTALRRQMSAHFDLLLGRKTLFGPLTDQITATSGQKPTRHQVHRIAHPESQQLAAICLPGRGCCRKNCTNQTPGRARPARVGKRASHPNPAQARFGGCVLADDLPNHPGQRQAVVCRRHNSGQVHNDGKPGHFQKRHDRQL